MIKISSCILVLIVGYLIYIQRLISSLGANNCIMLENNIIEKMALNQYKHHLYISKIIKIFISNMIIIKYSYYLNLILV